MTLDFSGESLRGILSQVKSVPVIPLDRLNGDFRNIHAVHGFYSLPNDSTSGVEQIREYRARTSEDALAQAKSDGLYGLIMVEQYLSAPQPCVLGLSQEEFARRIAEHEIWLTKRTTNIA